MEFEPKAFAILVHQSLFSQLAKPSYVYHIILIVRSVVRYNISLTSIYTRFIEVLCINITSMSKKCNTSSKQNNNPTLPTSKKSLDEKYVLAKSVG